MANLATRLTEALDLQCPIVSAPMAFAGGGRLAAAVSNAGGLGLIGGGYGDPAWLDAQFSAAGDAPVGVGFITWSLAESPQLLDQALARRPKAVMLSFGDPRPFAGSIHKAGARLICQCQNIGQVTDALKAGADIVVAQGGEAGGHGQSRATFTLVPEVADLLQSKAPACLLLAAGGIADGRGLAAALMLGADGALIGSRFWASGEALVHERHHQSILDTDGDGTVRTTVADIARQLTWPPGFSARIRRNQFTERWHGHEADLKEQVGLESPRYLRSMAEGDPEHTGVWFGEAAGLIDRIEPAADIIAGIVAQARQRLSTFRDLR